MNNKIKERIYLNKINKKPTKKAGLKKNKYEFYITRKYKNYIN